MNKLSDELFPSVGQFPNSPLVAVPVDGCSSRRSRNPVHPSRSVCGSASALLVLPLLSVFSTAGKSAPMLHNLASLLIAKQKNPHFLSLLATVRLSKYPMLRHKA
jgi:hypothetical protein